VAPACNLFVTEVMSYFQVIGERCPKVNAPVVHVAERGHRVYLSCILKFITIAPATKEEGHAITIQLQQYLQVEKWPEAADPLTEQWRP
jgi:hypothetical protein